MSLDFKWTCPDIDSSLKDIQSSIEDNIKDLMAEVCPPLDGTPAGNILFNNYSLWIYEAIEPIVEEVRKTNSDMRDSAEKQISYLIEEMEDLKLQIADLESTIDDLEDEVAELESSLE